MGSTPVRVEDFNIAWICALPEEFSAAVVVLDDEYTDIAEAAQYALGRIASHKVVVAVLPAGQYGTNSAAVAAANLQSTFPCIQYWLMVGIGGGVPGAATDVRLGDVVVCRPKDQHGGVVQYDLGKKLPNGQEVRTGLLNAPPTVLGTAVSRLQSKHALKRSRLKSILVAFSELSDFQRPAGVDILFEATSRHERGEDCRHCHKGYIVQRSRREIEEPVVHFGLIASGNQVIKDGVFRDTLSSQLGGVLCFEMEAAGLINSFPCLVVRGICDYADSHKNKKWQPYAAATAAACAKELLEYIPARQSHTPTTNKLTRSSSSTTDLLGGLSQEEIQRQTDIEKSINADRYFRSLKFDNIDTRYASIRSAHLETCRWVLNTPEYKSWQDHEDNAQHNGFLWIKGKPGTGKSTLMKFIVSHVRESHPKSTISCFFFNARGQALEKSTLGMYKSLLHQILESLPQLKNVLDLCPPAKSATGGYTWNVEDLKTAFENIVLRLRTQSLVVLVDALDECEEGEVRSMVSFFEHLGEAASDKGLDLRTCFSSRHYPSVVMGKSVQLILEDETDHGQDIAKYLRSELKAGTSSYVNEIRSEILRRASGIFLWVVLVVSILNTEFARGNKRSMKSRLSEIPNGLEQLFYDILTKDSQNMEQLMVCLKWVLFAQRPLKVEELYYGILAGTEPDAIEVWNPEEVDLDDMRKFILNNSKGLVEEVRMEPKVVQFIHESVRDFLLSGKAFGMQRTRSYADFEAQSHETLKVCCQHYLLRFDLSEILDSLKKLPTASSIDAQTLKKATSRNFPLLEYTVEQIFYHSDKANSLGISQLGFLRHFPLRNWTILHNVLAAERTHCYTLQVNLLYIVAEKDLPSLTSLIIGQGQSIDIRGEIHCFPLFAARVFKSEAALRALLLGLIGTRSDVSQPDIERAVQRILSGRIPDYNNTMTILSWAIKSGNRVIWQIFLPEGIVNDRIVINYGLELFDQASRHGHTGIMRQLLAYDRNWDHSIWYDEKAISKWSTTVADGLILPWKVLHSHYGGIKLADRSWSPLQLALLNASTNGHRDVVQLLLLQYTGLRGYLQTIIDAIPGAAAHGHTDIVVFLLDRLKIGRQRHAAARSALKPALDGGHTKTLEVLLLHGLDPHSWKATGHHVMEYACFQGDSNVVRLLAKHGMNADMVGPSRLTMLHLASSKGHLDVVKLLLEHGAMMEARDDKERTPLMFACMQSQSTIVDLLIQNGAEPGSRDDSGRTPLMWASSRGDIESVKLLTRNQAYLHLRDKHGESASDIAHRKGFAEICELLTQGSNIAARRSPAMSGTKFE